MRFGENTRTRVTLHDRATADFGESSAIGVERTSYAEVNVLDSATLSLGTTYGALIGAKENWTDTGSLCPTGVVNVAGTATVDGHYYGIAVVDNHQSHRGLLIGGMTGGRQISGTCWSRGVVNVLPGGTFTHKYGLLTIGQGFGEGELNVNGGTFTKSVANGYAVVGMGGGQGLVSVTGGGSAAFACPAYVGGVETNTIDRMWAYFPEDSMAATGRVSVANGTVAFNGACAVFGGKGTGILEIGPGGAVTAKDVVLSNNVASVVSFRVGERDADYGTLNVSGQLTIAPGAKLVVDATAFAGRKSRLPVIRAAGGIVGAFAAEDVTLLGKGVAVRADGTGISVLFPRGTVMSLR